MADTENAGAAAANPAEVPKTESSDAKPTTSTDVAADAKTQDAGEEKWELNGKSDDRDERRGGRNSYKRNDRDDRRGGGRGGGRGRGRGRGGYGFNKKCVFFAA